ncbi:MAG: PAS domain-containing protein, partial [Alphaproteobacteria bacterium]
MAGDEARKLRRRILIVFALWGLAFTLTLFWFTGGVTAIRAQHTGESSSRLVRIGVLATEGGAETLKRWGGLNSFLNEKAKEAQRPYQFSIVPLSHGRLLDAAEGNEVDLVVSDAASFAALEVEAGARALLSMARFWDGRSVNATGALVFARADSDYRRLGDLREARVMAVAPNDFAGWFLGAQEFRKLGVDPSRFFRELVFSGGSERDVVLAVKSGLVDVGVVRAGVLEELDRRGEISLVEFRPLMRRNVSGFPFWVSSPLYPDWVLAAMPGVDEEVLAFLTNRLLTLKPDAEASLQAGGIVWEAPKNYTKVHDLLISLRVRPYENYLVEAARRIFQSYKVPIVAIFVATLGSLAFLGYEAWRNMQLAEARRDVLHSERRSKQFYRDAVEEHTVFCMLSGDGKITHMNQRFLNTTGRQRKELLGCEFVSLLDGRHRALLVDDVFVTMRDGEPWSGPIRIVRPDDSSAWVQCTFIPVQDTTGKFREVAFVASDLTETWTNIAEEKFNDALELVEDQVVVLRPGTLEILYCNQAAARKLVKERVGGDWKGKPVREVITAEDYKSLCERCEALIAGPQRRATWEVSAKDGVYYEISLEYVQPEGQEPRFVAIYRDISERMAADKAKREFLATISHELRTPLTSVKGALGLALSGSIGEIPEKVKGMLALANTNSERLITLINDILDLEKAESGKMEFNMAEVDLAELVTTAVKSNDPYAHRHGVSLRLEVEKAGGAAFMTVGDAGRLMQVMDNLLSNACKFSDKGGEVVVKLTLHRDWNRISVQDHGVGIPEAAFDKIFDKFTQADSSDTRSKGGTGLGLAITKLIVKEHRGYIWFVSEEGVGTEFFVDLPRLVGKDLVYPADEGAGAARRARSKMSEDPKAPAPDPFELLSSTMSELGAEVTVESGGPSDVSVETLRARFEGWSEEWLERLS